MLKERCYIFQNVYNGFVFSNYDEMLLIALINTTYDLHVVNE